MARKSYIGKVTERDWHVMVSEGDELRTLRQRQDIQNHSPDGFSWGYMGSGPSQLALAILADATSDDDFAVRNYMKFRDDKIVSLEQDKNWRMSEQDIMEWISKNGN